MHKLLISLLLILLSATVTAPAIASVAENQELLSSNNATKKCTIKTPQGNIPCYPMNTQG